MGVARVKGCTLLFTLEGEQPLINTYAPDVICLSDLVIRKKDSNRNLLCSVTKKATIMKGHSGPAVKYCLEQCFLLHECTNSTVLQKNRPPIKKISKIIPIIVLLYP